MTTQEKKILKNIMTQEIDALTLELQNIEKSLKPIKKDCSLDSIDHKMFLKVDTEEYGVCKECEEDIALERLKLIPESQYCVSCMNELGL